MVFRRRRKKDASVSDETSDEGVATAPSGPRRPTAAPSDAPSEAPSVDRGGKVSLVDAARWLVTTPPGIVVSLAATLTAFATVTEFGQRGYERVRPFVLAPSLDSKHECLDKNNITLRATAGWTSVSVESLQIRWFNGTQDEEVGYRIKLASPDEKPPKFPIHLDAGETLTLAIENRTGGFYAQHPTCQLKIVLHFENDPPPPKPDKDEFTCACP